MHPKQKQKRHRGKFGVVGSEPLAPTMGIRLPQSLDRQVRIHADQTGKSLTDVLTAAVRDYFASLN